MKLHLLSARSKTSFVSTRWISDNSTIIEILLEGKFDGEVIELDALEEVLFVPPYGVTTIQVDLSKAKTFEAGKTKRGERLVRVIGGCVTINDVEIRRRASVPRLVSSQNKEPDPNKVQV